MLSAPERERLRRERDRVIRQRIGSKLTDDQWTTTKEAAALLGIPSSEVRQRILALDIRVRQKSGTMLVPVRSLDLLR